MMLITLVSVALLATVAKAQLVSLCPKVCAEGFTKASTTGGVFLAACATGVTPTYQDKTNCCYKCENPCPPCLPPVIKCAEGFHAQCEKKENKDVKRQLLGGPTVACFCAPFESNCQCVKDDPDLPPCPCATKPRLEIECDETTHKRVCVKKAGHEGGVLIGAACTPQTCPEIEVCTCELKTVLPPCDCPKPDVPQCKPNQKLTCNGGGLFGGAPEPVPVPGADVKRQLLGGIDGLKCIPTPCAPPPQCSCVDVVVDLPACPCPKPDVPSCNPKTEEVHCDGGFGFGGPVPLPQPVPQPAPEAGANDKRQLLDGLKCLPTPCAPPPQCYCKKKDTSRPKCPCPAQAQPACEEGSTAVCTSTVGSTDPVPPSGGGEVKPGFAGKNVKRQEANTLFCEPQECPKIECKCQKQFFCDCPEQQCGKGQKLDCSINPILPPIPLPEPVPLPAPGDKQVLKRQEPSKCYPNPKCNNCKCVDVDIQLCKPCAIPAIACAPGFDFKCETDHSQRCPCPTNCKCLPSDFKCPTFYSKENCEKKPQCDKGTVLPIFKDIQLPEAKKEEKRQLLGGFIDLKSRCGCPPQVCVPEPPVCPPCADVKCRDEKKFFQAEGDKTEEPKEFEEAKKKFEAAATLFKSKQAEFEAKGEVQVKPAAGDKKRQEVAGKASGSVSVTPFTLPPVPICKCPVGVCKACECRFSSKDQCKGKWIAAAAGDGCKCGGCVPIFRFTVETKADDAELIKSLAASTGKKVTITKGDKPNVRVVTVEGNVKVVKSDDQEAEDEDPAKLKAAIASSSLVENVEADAEVDPVIVDDGSSASSVVVGFATVCILAIAQLL